MKNIVQNKFMLVIASILITVLSGCASLHDGEGFEHKQGESEISHKH